MKRIKVGVVGLGEVAQIIHLPILTALSERYEIAAVCDVSPRLLEVIGDQYGVARRYADASTLTEQDDLDAVFVLNSDEYHADCTIAAARNGRHVLVEKPMCLTLAEAEAIVRARDEAGVQVMVAYMRRFAPAFTQAVEEVRRLDRINHVRVRDIIGRNRLIIEQSSVVHRFDDIPPAALQDRADRARKLVGEAIGAASPELVGAYRLLCGLSSHDLSAMHELIGAPDRVVAAALGSGGRFLSAIFAYPGFNVTFETGVDGQRRFDAHIAVYGESRSITVQYDTPYIRHLPTTLVIQETVGDAFHETVIRPTFKDPYTHELEYFHAVVTQGLAPKTTPEDFRQDLHLFRLIVDALRQEQTA